MEHVRSPGATPLKKAHSYPQYCQLSMTPQLGVGLHSHLPFSKFSAEILSESNVHWFCVRCHHHCEFIRASFLLCLEKTVSLWSPLSSNPYRLSLSLSAMVTEPWEEDCVIQMPHVGFSKLSHSFSAPWSLVGFWINCFLLQREVPLPKSWWCTHLWVNKK